MVKNSQITDLESNVRELDAIAGRWSLTCPELVYIKTVCCVAGDEVLEQDVPNRAGTAVRLDHVRLVTAVGVDVAIDDVVDVDSGRQTTHCGSTGLVAPDALNEEVACRVLGYKY